MLVRRQCIGRNVANQFVLKLIAQLLLRFEIELEEPDLILGTKEFTIQKPARKFNVILKFRNVGTLQRYRVVDVPT